MAEIRADVKVQNLAASYKTRQSDAIDLSDFLLMLPDSYFSRVERNRRSL